MLKKSLGVFITISLVWLALTLKNYQSIESAANTSTAEAVPKSRPKETASRPDNTTEKPNPKTREIASKNEKANNSSSTKKRQRLDKLKTCYQSQTCNYPNTDPKSYYFAVGQDLKKELNLLSIEVSKKKIQEPWVSEIAREFLASDDGHVKEAALELLSSQPIEAKSLDAILAHIIGYHDAKLIEHAMLELRRYLGSPEEPKIHQGLSRAIRTGSPVVSIEVSRHISLFVNSSSLDIYRNTLTHLSAQSQAHKLLKVSVEEFHRRKNAA